MLEYFGDYFSYILLLIIVFIAIASTFSIYNKFHQQLMKERESMYQSFYEDADDDFDEENEKDEAY